jgi:hypothetical protein
MKAKQPPPAGQRTILRVRAVLGSEGFKSFRFVSRRFQMGKMTVREYYDSVEKTLPAQHINELAPPLFALLPNEKDRTELLQLHESSKNRLRVVSPGSVRKAAPEASRSPYQHPVNVSSSTDALADMLASQVCATSTRLVLLALHNDAPGTRNLLSLGVSPNHTNSLGQSALHVAAKHLHTETMVVLLDYGADANGTNKVTGSTPLHSLAQCADSPDPEHLCAVAQCIALLLRHGADPRRTDRSGLQAINCATERWGQASVQQWFEDSLSDSTTASTAAGLGGAAGGGAAGGGAAGGGGKTGKADLGATAAAASKSPPAAPARLPTLLHGLVACSAAHTHGGGKSSSGSNGGGSSHDLAAVLEGLFSTRESSTMHGVTCGPDAIAILDAVDERGYTALHLAVSGVHTLTLHTPTPCIHLHLAYTFTLHTPSPCIHFTRALHVHLAYTFPLHAPYTCLTRAPNVHLSCPG